MPVYYKVRCSTRDLCERLYGEPVKDRCRRRAHARYTKRAAR